MFGGPIGARLTMAVARLVMQSWKDNYDKILDRSQIDQLLSGLYVDDGRNLHRKLNFGEYFDHVNQKFAVSEEKKLLDLENRITREEITKKEVLAAMNSINEDLNFTMELCTDFVDGRLPTLSFSIWQGVDRIEHSYFEKAMKNQTLLMARTAMSRHQMINIMSNELIRRLEMVDDCLGQQEKNDIVNKYTQQLVNSEYNWKLCREIVVSGIVGFVRKLKRKVKQNIPKFRSGQFSLRTRVNKKLTEKYNWFRVNKVNMDDETVSESVNNSELSKKKNKWHHYSKKHAPIEAIEKVETKDAPLKLFYLFNLPKTVN